LLADDNPINQKVGLSVLQKLGYRADLANNGLEVLHALDQKVYDLLFLDVQMPEMDGLEATRQICKRWSPERRPAIVAMTGNALMGDREKCLAAGMDDYISKPVRVAEIQAAIERWGPLKTTPFDTQILLRAKAAPPSDLLEEKLLLSFRSSPPDSLDSERVRIQKLIETAPQHLTQLASFPEDPAQVATAAAALKHLSIEAGAKRMAALCQQLAQHDPGRSSESVSQLVQELRVAFVLTRTQLVPLLSHPADAGYEQ
jgi:CheY-like chemotaxis protein